MAMTSIKIENGVARRLGLRKDFKGRKRFKRWAKKMRNRIIRRSNDPKGAVKQYHDWEY